MNQETQKQVSDMLTAQHAELKQLCDDGHKYREMKWSKELPTSEGYYWLYVPEWELDPEVVWVFNSGGIAEPCYEFNRMIDGFSSPDYVSAPTNAQWMKIETQPAPKE